MTTWLLFRLHVTGLMQDTHQRQSEDTLPSIVFNGPEKRRAFSLVLSIQYTLVHAMGEWLIYHDSWLGKALPGQEWHSSRMIVTI